MLVQQVIWGVAAHVSHTQHEVSDWTVQRSLADTETRQRDRAAMKGMCHLARTRSLKTEVVDWQELGSGTETELYGKTNPNLECRRG